MSQSPHFEDFQSPVAARNADFPRLTDLETLIDLKPAGRVNTSRVVAMFDTYVSSGRVPMVAS